MKFGKDFTVEPLMLSKKKIIKKPQKIRVVKTFEERVHEFVWYK